MDSATRPLEFGEQSAVDADEMLPFGTFAPDVRQRLLIGLAKRSFLSRGLFRRSLARAVTGNSGRPVDVSFRGCAYRLRGENNLIELGILLRPDYNAADIDFLLSGSCEGDCFVDVGANIGLYTLPLAQRAGPSGKVVAIDANPLMARRLAWNAAASGLANIDVVNCAVSDREGKGVLTIRKADVAIVAVEEVEDGPVPVRTLAAILDDSGLNRLHGLKIDIEGHEDKALAPFIRTAAAGRLPRRIVIERAPAGDYPACEAAFAERGYRRVGQSRNTSFFSLD